MPDFPQISNKTIPDFPRINHKSRHTLTEDANTGPLKDEVLSQAGANLVFPSIEALCSEWEKLFEALK